MPIGSKPKIILILIFILSTMVERIRTRSVSPYVSPSVPPYFGNHPFILVRFSFPRFASLILHLINYQFIVPKNPSLAHLWHA